MMVVVVGRQPVTVVCRQSRGLFLPLKVTAGSGTQDAASPHKVSTSAL